MGAKLWCEGKTSHSEKSIAEHWVKHYFGIIAQTGAVRKGEFLRGKVSQGRPHPLRLGVKVRLCKTKMLAELYAQRVFVFLPEPWHDVGTTL